MDIQEKANKIWAELECEPSGELARVHSNSAIKAYVFSAENMEKLENSYKQVYMIVLPIPSGMFDCDKC